LSVEEQFYLAFPLILAFCWALSRKRRRFRHATGLLVGLISVASFGLALIVLSRPAGANAEWLIGFYGPFSRAWEFAAGALLALSLTKRRVSQGASSILGYLGLALMVTSLYAISESTPFPGPWTLLPVVAALALLIAGAHEATAVSRALSSRPLVKIGDWSYSIYLWHWPLIVFAKVLWPASHVAVICAALLSLVPALASYLLVETPIRRMSLASRAAVKPSQS